MKLTRLQLATVRQMAKSLVPIERKITSLINKKDKLDEEISQLQDQILNIHTAIESFTGGLSLTEIFTPEAVISEEATEIENIDDTEQVEQTVIVPGNSIIEYSDLKIL